MTVPPDTTDHNCKQPQVPNGSDNMSQMRPRSSASGGSSPRLVPFMPSRMPVRSPDEFLARHVTGDWGDLDDEDKQPQRRRPDRRQPHPVGVHRPARGSGSGSSRRRLNEVGLRYCTT